MQYGGHVWKELFMNKTYKEIHLNYIGSSKLTLKKIIDDENGLSIITETANNQEAIINFDFFYSYRNTDESYRLKTINELRCMSESSIFISTNSDYLDWFNYESLGIYSNEKQKHYVILTSENVIDVLSLDEPSITIC